MTRIRRRRDAVEVTLSSDEAQVLAMFADLVASFLTPDEPEATSSDPLEAMLATSADPVDAPDDPALLRLLPDAYGDAEAAGEFRRLMESDLRRQKIDALDAVKRALADESGGRVVVAIVGEEIETWLQAINDIRLFLGSRLEVTEELAQQIEALDPDDPRLPQLLAFDWLGYIQEALLQVID